jgi:hypothetical protein
MVVGGVGDWFGGADLAGATGDGEVFKRTG